MVSCDPYRSGQCRSYLLGVLSFSIFSSGEGSGSQLATSLRTRPTETSALALISSKSSPMRLQRIVEIVLTDLVYVLQGSVTSVCVSPSYLCPPPPPIYE